VLKLDKRSLRGDNYIEVSFEKRQIIDIESNIIIKEYQAQMLENLVGKRFVA
jgi:hypothetical protein